MRYSSTESLSSSATGYIYTYEMMAPHDYALKMQQEMTAEIENAAPEFIVYVNVPTSWLTRSDSQKLIFDWFRQYQQQQHYGLVGIIDIVSMKQTVYNWDEAALGYKPKSKLWISVMKRTKQ